MGKLLTINIHCEKSGEIELLVNNVAGLDNNSYKDALAFSAPLLLARHLADVTLRSGVHMCLGIPYPGKIGKEKIPPRESKFGDVKAKLEITISRDKMVRSLFKPSIGFFTTYPEEKVSHLVKNYLYHIGNMDLYPYLVLVDVALNFIGKSYDRFLQMEFNTKTVTEASYIAMKVNRSSKMVRSAMLDLSINLYKIWSTYIHEEAKKMEREKGDSIDIETKIDEYIFCRHCSEKILADSKFCFKCGKQCI